MNEAQTRYAKIDPALKEAGWDTAPFRLVMEQQAAMWKLKAKRLVGGVFRALVVAPGVARLESQAPDVDGVVYLDGAAAAASVGEFVQVRLVRSRGFDFVAE